MSGKVVGKFKKVSLAQFMRDGGNRTSYEAVSIPVRSTVGSAGYDFVTPVSMHLEPGESMVVPTGIRCKILEGYLLSIYPRSGLGFKKYMQLANTVGIIDSDYYGSSNEGHIMVKVRNTGKEVLELSAGERFCQGIFTEYFLAEDDCAMGTRDGGFGSTGE